MNKEKLFYLGSLPHSNPIEAIEFVKKHSSHLPFLPQLPESHPQEDMIGQVLRGIDLGFWDEKASSCLELFQNEFVDSPRYKIQIAGPYTVARSMSAKFLDVAPLWVGFWKGLRKQLREAAFQGELWLQIDEPFWNSALPYICEGYTAFLQSVKEVDWDIKLGVHSCATLRPFPFVDHINFFDFLSFDFTQSPMTPQEEENYGRWLCQKGKNLVWGGLKAGNNNLNHLFKDHPQVWISPPCGFYGWEISELERQVGEWEK